MPKPRVVAALVAIAALPTIVAAVEPEFSAERLRAHVTFLADDLLGDAKPALVGMTSPPITLRASLPCWA